MKKKGLTLTQALMLLLIFRAGKATMHELADQMVISAPSASVLVDRLYEMGLIIREAGLSDRRKKTIQIHAGYMETVARFGTSMAKKLSVLTGKSGEKDFFRAHENFSNYSDPIFKPTTNSIDEICLMLGNSF